MGAVNFLKPDKIIILPIGKKSLTVKQKIIPDSLRAQKDIASWVKKGQPMKPCACVGAAGKPLGICVHNTEDIKVATGTNAAEQYCRATYNGNMRGVVVHYYVYKSEVWQLLRLDERGWHAGDGSTKKKIARSGKMLNGNRDTIAIEAIGSGAETEETTALLCAWLSKEFKFEPNVDVYQHWDFSGKNCPVYIRRRKDGWKEFVAAIMAAMWGTALHTVVSPDEIKVGDRVRVKATGIPYFPGEKEIPEWLLGRVFTVNGLAEKGGVQCARLQEITSLCDVKNLEKVKE